MLTHSDIRFILTSHKQQIYKHVNTRLVCSNQATEIYTDSVMDSRSCFFAVFRGKSFEIPGPIHLCHRIFVTPKHFLPFTVSDFFFSILDLHRYLKLAKLMTPTVLVVFQVSNGSYYPRVLLNLQHGSVYSLNFGIF